MANKEIGEKQNIIVGFKAGKTLNKKLLEFAELAHDGNTSAACKHLLNLGLSKLATPNSHVNQENGNTSGYPPVKEGKPLSEHLQDIEKLLISIDNSTRSTNEHCATTGTIKALYVLLCKEMKLPQRTGTLRAIRLADKLD